jgi:hypothetical protein
MELVDSLFFQKNRLPREITHGTLLENHWKALENHWKTIEITVKSPHSQLPIPPLPIEAAAWA